MGKRIVHTTLHHLNPRSRKKDLLRLCGIENPDPPLLRKINARKPVEEMAHTCWHLLFSNFFAWEAVEQIKLWATDDLADFRIYLDIKTKMAWHILFGGMLTPKEAISVIENKWWPEYPPVGFFANKQKTEGEK